MINGRMSAQAMMCRRAAGWFAAGGMLLILLSAVMIAGCRPDEPSNGNEGNGAEFNDHDWDGVDLTTNGVPISIYANNLSLGTEFNGTIVVSSFPEAQADNDNGENGETNGNGSGNGNETNERDSARIALAMLKQDSQQNPGVRRTPSRHFKIGFPENDNKNWIRLERRPPPDKKYPRSIEFTILPIKHNNTDPLPGAYDLVVVVLPNEIEPAQLGEPGERREERGRVIGVFTVQGQN